MAVAVFRRFSAHGEIFDVRHVRSVSVTEAGDCKLAAERADTGADDVPRLNERDHSLFGVNAVHDVFPDFLLIVVHGDVAGQCDAVVKTGPDAHRVIVGIADEPEIAAFAGIVGCRTGFAGGRHASVKRGSRGIGIDPGALDLLIDHGIGHGAREQPRGRRLDDAAAVLTAFEKRLAVVVGNLRIERLLNVCPAVRDRCVGIGQFQQIYAPGQAAEAQCRTKVGIDLIADGLPADERGKAELLERIKCLFDTDLIDHEVGGDDVHGVDHRHPGIAASQPEIVSPPVPHGIAFIGEGKIVLPAGKRDLAAVQTGSEGREHLEGGTRGTVGIDRTVEGAADALFAAAAADGQHLTGAMIDDDGGKLRLKGIVDFFVGHRHAVCCQIRFELGNECGDLFPGIENKIVQLVFFPDLIFVKGLRGPVFGFRHDLAGEGPFEAVCRIVGRIVDFFIQDCLNAAVQCRMDVQPAAVEQRVGIRFAVAEFGLQVGKDLIDDGVRKIGIGRRILADAQVVLGDALVEGSGIRHGLVVFCLCDLILVQHVVQHRFSAGGIVFGETDRIVAVGVLRDPGDAGAFRQRQITDVLAEITLARHLDTQAVLAEVDRIEVTDQDLFLRDFVLQLDGQILLLELPDEARAPALFRASVKDIVLDELLGDGGSAAVDLSAEKQRGHGAEHPADVHAFMRPETFVLDSDESVDEVLRNGGVGDRVAVGTGFDQGLHSLPVSVVQRRGDAERRNGKGLRLRRLIDDALYGTVDETAADRRGKHGEQHHELQRMEDQAARHLP